MLTAAKDGVPDAAPENESVDSDLHARAFKLLCVRGDFGAVPAHRLVCARWRQAFDASVRELRLCNPAICARLHALALSSLTRVEVTFEVALDTLELLLEGCPALHAVVLHCYTGDRLPDLTRVRHLECLEVLEALDLDDIATLRDVCGLKQLALHEGPLLSSLPELGGLVHLTELSLRDLPRLESLDLPPELSDIRKLEICNCGAISQLTWPEAMYSLTGLTIISQRPGNPRQPAAEMASGPVPAAPAPAPAIVAAPRALPRIESVHLCGCTLVGPEPLEQLLPTCLRHLDLSTGSAWPLAAHPPALARLHLLESFSAYWDFAEPALHHLPHGKLTSLHTYGARPGPEHVQLIGSFTALEDLRLLEFGGGLEASRTFQVPVARLEWLTRLECSHPHSTGLGGYVRLQCLVHLALHRAAWLLDLSAVGMMDNLEHLYLDAPALRSLDGLQACETLRHLELCTAGASPISVLSQLTALTFLQVRDVYGGQLDALATLTALQELRILTCTNALQVVTVLTNLRALHLLEVFAPISPWPTFACLHILTHLTFTWRKGGALNLQGLVPQLRCICECPALEFLSLDTLSPSVDAVPVLTGVPKQYIVGTMLYDEQVALLQALTRLRELHLHAVLASLQPLAGMRQLRRLRLTGRSALGSYNGGEQLPRLRLLCAAPQVSLPSLPDPALAPWAQRLLVQFE